MFSYLTDGFSARDFTNELVLTGINDHVVYCNSRLEKEKLFK